MNSTWLITSELANQRVRKVLINTVLLTYQKIHQELEELKNQHNIEVMKTCDVIGMTVTGATIRANLLGNYEIKLFT